MSPVSINPRTARSRPASPPSRSNSRNRIAFRSTLSRFQSRQSERASMRGLQALRYAVQGWSQGELIAMDGAVFTALVSGAVALATVALTQGLSHYFGRKRDHEADWRKMKLDHYKEYVAALPGTVHHPYDAAVQRRYSDAVNTLSLVAPPKVLLALYPLLDETSVGNQTPTLLKYEALLSSLMRAMREDSHPKPPKNDSEFTFRTLDCPPEKDEESKRPQSSSKK